MNAKRILGQIFLGTCFSTAVFGAAGTVEEVATLSKIAGRAVASKGVRYIRAHEGMNEAGRRRSSHGNLEKYGFWRSRGQPRRIFIVSAR